MDRNSPEARETALAGKWDCPLTGTPGCNLSAAPVSKPHLRVPFLAHSGLSFAEPKEITDPIEGIHFMLTSPFPYKY